MKYELTSADRNDELMLPCGMYPSYDYHCHSSAAGAWPDICSLSYAIKRTFPDAPLVQLMIEKGEFISTGSE